MKMNKLVKYGLLAGFSAMIFVGQAFADVDATMATINSKSAEAASLAASSGSKDAATRQAAIKKARALAQAAYDKLNSGEDLAPEERAKLLDVLTQVEGSLNAAVADLASPAAPAPVAKTPVVAGKSAKVNVFSVPWESAVVQDYFEDLVGEWSDNSSLFGTPKGDDTGTAVTPG
jgi:hypothetical protein